MIGIVDYGAGNLRSVEKALARLGHACRITSDPGEIASASGVILPGVGAAAGIMDGLRSQRLVQPILETIRRGTPFLGVCMGLQVLFDWSDEGGGEPCLGVLPGHVRRLPDGMKVPHMGWNSVRQTRPHSLWEGIADNSFFYFVHSYYVEPAEPTVVIGETEYGIAFPVAVASGNVMGTQFHPEKSGSVGLKVYDNFAKLVNYGFSGNTRG